MGHQWHSSDSCSQKQWELLCCLPGWGGNPQQYLERSSPVFVQDPEEDFWGWPDPEHVQMWVGEGRDQLHGVSARGEWGEAPNQQIQSFLQLSQTKKEVWLVRWYRHFIPSFFRITVPLTNLTTKTVKNPVTWMEDFTQLKYHLYTSPVLRSLDFTKMFLDQVNDSAKGIWAVYLTSAVSFCPERQIRERVPSHYVGPQ